MDRGKRPVGREKHVGGGSSQVHKRGEGLHTGGPVGNQEGYSGRGHAGGQGPVQGGGHAPGSQGHGQGGSQGYGHDRGLLDDALGGLGGNENMEHMIENLVVNEVAGELSGRRKKKPSLLILGVAALLLLGGGGSLGALLGGGSTGADTSHSLMNSYSGYSDSWGSADTWSTDTSSGYQSSGGSGYGSSGSGSYGGSDNTGILNTKVSPDARDKRTVIKGGGKDTITIMVYMCGTDLESRSGMATSDLQEMAAAELSDKINLLVYTGGCEQWRNNVVSSSTNQIYQIKDNGLLPLEKNLGSKPMTDPDTLSEYIRWAKKNFPADRYDLIMWDHGGGSTSGYGYDQLYSGYGSMTLDKISTALKDGGCAFDFVGFDACLMATLETALVVEPYADYLIASEETEPGVGWYYTDWLTRLSQDTSSSTLEIGRSIVDDFVSVCGQKVPGDQTTLSVIDLAELKGTVPEKFKKFAQSTTSLIRKDDYREVSNARSVTKEFAKSIGIDQVDLINLSDNLATEESRELAEVLRSAVKYNLTSRNVHNAYGISIYFPYGKISTVNKMVNTYSKIGLDDAYADCIKSFASLEAGGQAVAGGSAGQLESLFGSLFSGGSSYSSGQAGDGYSSGPAGNSYASGMAGGDLVTELLGSLLSGRSLANIGLDEESAGFLDNDIVESSEKYLTDNQFDTSNLIWKDKDGEEVLKLKEEQWDLIQSVELNVFVDDGEGYIYLGLDNIYRFDDDGDLVGDYDRTWIALDGQIVAYYMVSAQGDADDYAITGRVPALLNGERVELILSFTDENPDGEVIGARLCYSGGETETQAKGLIELETGDTLDFLCDYYDYDQEYTDSYYLGEQMTVYGDLTVNNVSMTNTDYIAAYRLTDIYHNHYWTPQIMR